jgi:formate hydrogenlyase subunit 6/NADH:ubiquinone oxidoreductase subunit I
MIKSIKKIIKYPRLTFGYPKEPMESKFFAATPEVEANKCNMCGQCLSSCPSDAIIMDNLLKSAVIDYNKCIFCALCEDLCPTEAIKMTNRFEIAKTDKSKLTTS